LSFFFILLPPPRPTLFPYTTLFRSLMQRVLIVDDEPNIRRMVASLLRAEGFEVAEAGSAQAGLTAVREEEPDAVLMDLAMPGGTDRKSTRLNSSHVKISYAVFCLKK